MKFKTLTKILKISKAVGKVLGQIKTFFPKSQKVDKNEELVKEIRAMRADLKKRDERIRDIISEELNKRGSSTKKKKDTLKDEPKAQESDDWVQAELYTTAVESGKNDSYGNGYILVNLPLNEWNEIKDKFNNMPVNKIKQHLGLEQKMVVRSVSKGETISTEKQRFVEINGQREDFKKLADVERKI